MGQPSWPQEPEQNREQGVIVAASNPRGPDAKTTRIACYSSWNRRGPLSEIQSLITDEHRAQIGKEGEPTTVTVDEEHAQRLRRVLGDEDPRWAEGTGIAPPYIIAMLGGGPRAGFGVRVLPSGIMTNQEWRFTRPFRIGETLTAINQVVDIRERLGGRYGHSVLVTSSTDYYDTDGNHVAAMLVTGTQFDPKGAEGRGQ